MDIDDFRVRPAKPVHLDKWSTRHTKGVSGKAEGRKRLQQNIEALAVHQERLYVQDRYALLVILQAMDAAGKDSTIKHVMSGVNPQGVQVHSFKAPSTLELDHDYMWRSAIRLPERGTIGIHNRSYYEEVLVARVHPEILARQQLPDEARRGNIWRRRFDHINNFEKFLVENGTVVLKLFLHVSFEKQRERFLERLDNPEKYWKFSLRDVQERTHWNDYQKAYEEMLEHTSTDIAPWYVVPADRKWYMQLAVGEIITQTLAGLKLKLPKLDDARRRELSEGRALLAREAGDAPARSAPEAPKRTRSRE
jgi:PPK2 family polyphosphate:nucleotide phosphotransferase